MSVMNSQLVKILPLCVCLWVSAGASAQVVAPDAATNTNASSDLNANQASDTSPETGDAEQYNPVDPWQGYNRAMFSFNLKVDKFVLKPIAKAYVKLTPGFFRQGVSNVFANILDVPNSLNDALQGKFSKAAHDGGRVLINTTLGIGGLLDVAQHMGLPSSDGEDFGQTLATWGVGTGPYVVLPFVGSSTLRDTFAMPVDWYSDPKTYIEHIPTKNTVRAVSIVDTRAGYLSLEKSITGDKYVFIRDVYLQRRNFLIKDGEVEDSFGEDETDAGD